MISKKEKEILQDEQQKSRISTVAKPQRDVNLEYQTPETDIRKTIKIIERKNEKQQNNSNLSQKKQMKLQSENQQVPQRQQQQQQSKQSLQVQIKKTEENQQEQVQSSSQFFQNPEKMQVQDPLRASKQKDKFETEFREIFLKLKKNNKIINPLQLVIKENVEPQNRQVLLYVLSDQMRRVNRAFFKSHEPNDRLLYSFQGQFTADSEVHQTYSLILQDTPSLKYEYIDSDKKFKEDFVRKLKKCLSIDLKVKEDQIQIIALKKGSTEIIFQILGFSEDNTPLHSNFGEVLMKFPGTEPSVSLYEYFETAALSDDDFAPQYNTSWDGYVFGNYEERGPKGHTQPYFFPVGWHGYALNVAGKYGNNDNWLMQDNNNEEWYAMFHGTNFRVAPKILKEGFREGFAQGYQNDICLLTKQKIGRGVYFSNHIEVCEDYAECTQIGNNFFKLAFQSRVRPEALRQCKKESDLKTFLSEYKKQNKDYYVQSLNDMKMWDNDYYLVKESRDIRPYRILIKQISQQTRF